MVKPSLHEIAAMPFPTSLHAMRQHYNPDWGKPLPEGKRQFRVRADWTVSGSLNDVIDAADEKEARELAREWAWDDVYSGDLDLVFREVEELRT